MALSRCSLGRSDSECLVAPQIKREFLMKTLLLILSALLPLIGQTISGPLVCQQAQTCTYATSGGTPPYSYSLVSGSVGSINSSTGVYTAPSHVVPKQVINGCQAAPNNSVFNTRIDSLPVNANSDLWINNTDGNVSAGVATNFRVNGSVVKSTDQNVVGNFWYTPNPPGGTPLIFQSFPDEVSETGSAWTPPGLFALYDNHYLTTYRDTCQQQDVYKFFSTGLYVVYPAANSASGIVYSLEGNVLPPYGTDAAQMELTTELLHQDELLIAAAGNLDAIQHAVRFDLDTASLNGFAKVWPAQGTASGGCQPRGPAYGNGITGNGTSTVTAAGPGIFVQFYQWPTGTNIFIDSAPFTVVSVASDGLSMVVSGTVSSGSHTMTQPLTNCMPYGTRVRLKASFTWPHVYHVTVSGTTITAGAGDPFTTVWAIASPPYNTVIISSVSYTVTAVASGGTSLTVSSAPPSGAQSMTNPSYTPDCDSACQNVVQAIVRQQKRYGLILADAGTSWGGNGDYGYSNYSVNVAAKNIGASVTNNGFNGLIGGNYPSIPTAVGNYEVVDESSLQTNQTYSSVDPLWGEARIDNGFVVPSDSVVIKVTDNASSTAFYSVALQGVAIGGEHPNELVMAGADPFTLHPWVTGTSNGAFTCSLSPSGGANGTISSGCTYTPPAPGAISTLTTTTVTVTSTADMTVTKTIVLEIFPLSSDGKMHISLGKPYASGSPSYTDTNGIVWWNDMVEGLPVALFPDEMPYPYGNLWSDYPGTNYTTTAPGVYASTINNYNDHHFRVHVPSGTVTGVVLQSNLPAAMDQQGFSFDCNGTQILGNTDEFVWQTGTLIARPLTCVQSVVNGMMHMAVRVQGIGPFSSGIHNGLDTSLCGIPCYVPPTFFGGQNIISGLVISSVSGPAANFLTVRGGAFRGGKLFSAVSSSPTNLPIVSYDMFNGTWHHEQTLDFAYVGGSGDPTLAHSTLAGGKGYLADGVIGYQNPFAFLPLDIFSVTNGITDSCPAFECTYTWTTSVPHDIQVGDWVAVDGVLNLPFNVQLGQATAVTSNTVSVFPYGSSPQTWTPGGKPTLTKLLGNPPPVPTVNWVGWDQFPGNPPQPDDPTDVFTTITFKLDAQHPVSIIKVYEANRSQIDMSCFETAVVDFSNDGVTFSNQFTYTSTGSYGIFAGSGDRVDNIAQWITIPVAGGPITAQYVRLHFTHSSSFQPYSRIIALSEVAFQ